MPNHGYFVSDLHLFARRSRADEHVDAIRGAAADAHTFVLGGDIFDFRWTTLTSLDHTIDAAVEWLETLAGDHPHCEFHFVLGNHDHHHGFIERLGALADDTENLSWHPYFLRLGSSLFLHGDVADRKMSQQQLAARRDRFARHELTKGQLANALYDAAIEARLHLAVNRLAHPPQRVAKRIVSYLTHIGHGPHNGLEDIYFGHTHAALRGFEYQGLRFHNGGAPIKGLEFQVLKTRPLNGDADFRHHC